VLVAFIVLSAIFYILPAFNVGRGILLLSLLVFGTLQFFWHACFKLFLKVSGMVPKVIVLGTGSLAKCIGDLIVVHNNDHSFAGFVTITDDHGEIGDDNILGQCDDLHNIARQHGSSKIVISMMERRGCLPISELLKCRFDGIQIVDAVSFYEKMTGKLLVESINPGWFIFSEGFRITWMKSFMKYNKRILDFTLALIGLVLASPLLPIIFLAVKVESPGPAIFKQTRVGKDEKNFTIYKFRTMCLGAESETGAVWAQTNDPRVTHLGHFLRKTRLDEIPQLFNVLKGDMSFSGPRPERPEFVEVLKQKIPYYSNRHSVKPGVTGWAQVKYPYGASEDDSLEKLRYDLFYIKNYSIFLDFLIVLETFKVVIGGRGAR
jgi:sugar transferase (PEP-CTERM system associated)